MPRWRHGALAVPFCLLALSLVGALTFVPSATWIPQGTHPGSSRHPASPGPKMAISDEEGTKSADTAKRNVASLYGRSCESAFSGLTWDVEACKQLNMEFARRTNMVCVFMCVCMCVCARACTRIFVCTCITHTNKHTDSLTLKHQHTQRDDAETSPPLAR